MKVSAVMALLVAGLASAVAMMACVKRAEPPPEPANVALPPDSLYTFDVTLTDQRGDSRTLASFAGRPVLLAMFYATCPSACPILIDSMKQLEARLPDDVRERTQVLLVSLDPERDTPEVLAEAAARHRVDASRWTLARTDEDSVRDLAAVLGVAYKAQADGRIDHVSAVFLLDASGVIVERAEGLGQPTDAVERRLETM